MTDKQYVVRAAQLRGYALSAPTRKAPGILVIDWSSGKGVVAVDATTWSDARAQINTYALRMSSHFPHCCVKG